MSPIAMVTIAAVAAIAAPQPGPVTHRQPTDRCPKPVSIEAYRSTGPVTLRKLTDLPNANAYRAVYRTEGDCVIPVVVRYGIGRQ